jgi:agmatine deiminase
MPKTPAALGFRMPAEWEHHEATWLVWPHRLSDWPRKFSPIPWVYGEIVRKLAEGEKVRILVQSAAQEGEARRTLARVGVDAASVELLRLPTDRGWSRDMGPIFVRKGGRKPEVAIARFQFNGWAKYADHKNDARVPERAARALGLRVFPITVNGRPFVLEGGAIDVNGRGTLITTEECLLDPEVQVRNPGLSRRDVEQTLKSALGVTHVLWLGKGIAGDDTHGHVDDLCRFVGPKTVVLCHEKNPGDPNYRVLQENRERFGEMRLEDGSKPEIVALPMPAPLLFDGMRLPASYANFYVGNAAVIVPTFNDPADREALGILSELFTDRPVVGIHAVDLVWGLGTLHCLTQQQPSS